MTKNQLDNLIQFSFLFATFNPKDCKPRMRVAAASLTITYIHNKNPKPRTFLLNYSTVIFEPSLLLSRHITTPHIFKQLPCFSSPIIARPVSYRPAQIERTNIRFQIFVAAD